MRSSIIALKFYILAMWNNIFTMKIYIETLRSSIITMLFYILPLLLHKQNKNPTAKENAHFVFHPTLLPAEKQKEHFPSLFLPTLKKE